MSATWITHLTYKYTYRAQVTSTVKTVGDSSQKEPTCSLPSRRPHPPHEVTLATWCIYSVRFLLLSHRHTPHPLFRNIRANSSVLGRRKDAHALKKKDAPNFPFLSGPLASCAPFLHVSLLVAGGSWVGRGEQRRAGDADWLVSSALGSHGRKVSIIVKQEGEVQ